MKIRIAFYKGKGGIFNKIVRWWTNSIYSHAELVLPDGRTWIGISPVIKSAVTSCEGPNIKHADWDFVDINITQEQYNTIIEFFEDTKGQGYDWIGMLLSQFLPCKIKHRKRWYCSEWIVYALKIACVFDWRVIKIYERKDLSPVVLHKLVTGGKSNEEVQD